MQVEDDVEITIALVIEVVVDGTFERCLQPISVIEDLVPQFQRSCLIAND